LETKGRFIKRAASKKKGKSGMGETISEQPSRIGHQARSKKKTEGRCTETRKALLNENKELRHVGKKEKKKRKKNRLPKQLWVGKRTLSKKKMGGSFIIRNGATKRIGMVEREKV